MPTEFSADALSTPGERIKNKARGFRLRSSGLGDYRKLTDADQQKLAASIGIDTAVFSAGKRLYDSKQPDIKRLEAARSSVKSLFNKRTMPFPEIGVRILIVRAVDDVAQTNEINSFLQMIDDHIRIFDAAVKLMQENWHEVLADCSRKLGTKYDRSQYPNTDQIPQLLEISILPYNFELPDYYRHTHPARYQQAVAAMTAQFDETANMIGQASVQAVSDALDQLVESIKGVNDGKQKSFKTTTVGNVFYAIQAFEQQVKEFGIFSGTALEQEMTRLRGLLTHGANDATTLPSVLRSSESMRQQLLDKSAPIRAAFDMLLRDRPRRNIVREIRNATDATSDLAV